MVKKKFSDVVEIVRIRFNNILAFGLFNILKLFYYRNTKADKDTVKILFINTGLLGDVIISTVIFANENNLRNLYKEVYFLVNKKYEEVFNCYRGGINIIYWESEKYRFSLSYRIKFLKELNSLNINRSINITFARKIIDDEISLLNGAGEKICFKNNSQMVKSFSGYLDSYYDIITQPKTGDHFNDLIDILKSYGISKPQIETKVFLKEIKPKILNYDIESNGREKVFSISPFSSKQIKDWELKKYIELISILIEKYNPLIFVLDDKRRHEYIDKISLLSPKIIITTGLTTLSEVSYLISKSDLFIGNDSGLFHIAKTYNKKRIGIVGGGALNITLPYCSGENEILLYKEMECFKCHWVCRFNHSYCIQDISVLDVFDSVKKLLKDE